MSKHAVFVEILPHSRAGSNFKSVLKKAMKMNCTLFKDWYDAAITPEIGNKRWFNLSHMSEKDVQKKHLKNSKIVGSNGYDLLYNERGHQDFDSICTNMYTALSDIHNVVAVQVPLDVYAKIVEYSNKHDVMCYKTLP